MGHVIAPVRIEKNGHSREFALLVDTGSTYTWLPAKELKSLGVIPLRTMHFESIEGKSLKRQIGEAIVESGTRLWRVGRRTTTIVVFGEKGDTSVLGVHALEGLALEVDPAGRRLKKTQGRPGRVTPKIFPSFFRDLST